MENADAGQTGCAAMSFLAYRGQLSEDVAVTRNPSKLLRVTQFLYK